MTLKRVLRFGAILGLIAAGLLAVGYAAPSLRLLDAKPLRLFASANPHPRIAAVLVSGDMGLRYGMGPKVAPALARHGIPVIGVSSPVNFGTYRTRAEADAIVANAIRTALAQTGASRIVLVGQSFGADIIAATAADLPSDLRKRVAAITLVVPGESVFFRSDPTGITYDGTPDARPAASLTSVTYAPVICIHGLKEEDSLCPQLKAPRAQVIGLPGGHFLHNNDRLLVATILTALNHADPTIVS